LLFMSTALKFGRMKAWALKGFPEDKFLVDQTYMRLRVGETS